ncbi:hypothetical protein KW798_01880 [Candidatus Parcubacteria bacterium]|nr:hypothetical protein [Candidatus Parcubacteria bacterium]
MKWIIGIIVIAAVGAGLWYSGVLTPLLSMGSPTATTTVQTTTAAPSSSGLPTSDADSSDDALVKDAAAVDAQIEGLNQDSASVDQSLNDKPVEQSY